MRPKGNGRTESLRNFPSRKTARPGIRASGGEGGGVVVVLDDGLRRRRSGCCREEEEEDYFAVYYCVRVNSAAHPEI